MAVELDGSEVLALAATLSSSGERALKRARLVVIKSTAEVKRGGMMRAPVDTGNLRSSISGTSVGLIGEIGPTADYGKYVEEGTSRMAPQPYMRPALDAATPAFLAGIAAAGEEALNG